MLHFDDIIFVKITDNETFWDCAKFAAIVTLCVCQKWSGKKLTSKTETILSSSSSALNKQKFRESFHRCAIIVWNKKKEEIFFLSVPIQNIDRPLCTFMRLENLSSYLQISFWPKVLSIFEATHNWISSVNTHSGSSTYTMNQRQF